MLHQPSRETRAVLSPPQDQPSNGTQPVVTPTAPQTYTKRTGATSREVQGEVSTWSLGGDSTSLQGERHAQLRGNLGAAGTIHLLSAADELEDAFGLGGGAPRPRAHGPDAPPHLLRLGGSASAEGLKSQNMTSKKMALKKVCVVKSETCSKVRKRGLCASAVLFRWRVCVRERKGWFLNVIFQVMGTRL